MKKLLKGINKSAIIVTLLIVIPASFFAYQNYNFKKLQRLDIQNKKSLIQEAYDKCILLAWDMYKSDLRQKCWFYNHEATDCDLNYFKTYDIDIDIPIENLEKDRGKCVKDFPVEKRLYSELTPGIDLDNIVGNLSEREAVSKVISQEKVMAIVQFPIEEGYKITYEVENPTEYEPFWYVHLYKISDNKDIITVKYWEIDAFNGDVSEIER